MDLALIIIGVLLIIIGLIGSFVPVIPGPITAWLALLIIYQTSFVSSDFTFLAITLSISIGVFILDYFIPIIGAKKLGGTKSGIIGATVGLVVGLIFLGPLGVFMGTFLGAFIGELIQAPNDKRTALRAASGSLIGFLTGVFLKFSITLIFGYYFFKILLENH
tara:strand:- start:1343 stop:1831 length:489 start_codon:yes stop_codon:yes gene_type:complete